jgi:uncharacterized membrane protein YfcA
MATAKTILLAVLAGFTLVYVGVWITHVRRDAHADPELRLGRPTPLQSLIGFVTNFFDTLGIGSFAPTTAAFRFKRIVPDERIPGTLNVGHTLPTIAQAFIFISIIEVEATTLILLIAAATLGAWLGAGIVAGWPRRTIQLGMGYALLVAATMFVITNIGEMRGTPVFTGGDALGLSGPLLWVAVAGNFILGALMTLGVGLYAPCLIMISLLGMDPRTAYPVMMGSCAFLMPVASVKFIRSERYSLRPAIGLALAGIPAVLIAASLVGSLSLTEVRWLVIVVVLYTACTMIRAGIVERRAKPAVTVPAA